MFLGNIAGLSFTSIISSGGGRFATSDVILCNQRKCTLLSASQPVPFYSHPGTSQHAIRTTWSGADNVPSMASRHSKHARSGSYCCSYYSNLYKQLSIHKRTNVFAIKKKEYSKPDTVVSEFSQETKKKKKKIAIMFFHVI